MRGKKKERKEKADGIHGIKAEKEARRNTARQRKILSEMGRGVNGTGSARLYILDGQGKVAYKSGRGPFGFRAGEMEQALVMLLLDQQRPARTTASNMASGAGK